MTDYSALLTEHCPVELAVSIENNDLGRRGAWYWPDKAPQASGLSPDCRSAIVGYYSPAIGSQSWISLLDDYAFEAAENAASHSPETRKRIADAAERIVAAPELPGRFFGMLLRNGIDLREQLKARFGAGLAREDVPYPDELFIYRLYASRFDEPGAVDWLRSAISRIKGPIAMGHMFNTLETWKVPGRDSIYRDYIDDPRQGVTPFGTASGNPVADSARRHLGLPPFSGKTRVVDEQGHPIPYRTRPFGSETLIDP